MVIMVAVISCGVLFTVSPSQANQFFGPTVRQVKLRLPSVYRCHRDIFCIRDNALPRQAQAL